MFALHWISRRGEAGRAGGRRQGDLRLAHRRHAARHAGRGAVHDAVLLQPRGRAADRDARVAARHRAAGRAGPGAGRQSGQRPARHAVDDALAAGSAAGDARQFPVQADRLRASPSRCCAHVDGWIDGLELDAAREVVLFHLAFNVALALLFIFWTERIARHRRAPAARPSPPRTTRRSRAISTRPRSARPRWRSPTPRARRCASATSSRSMLNGMLQVHEDQRPRARRADCARWTTSSTSSTRRSSST